MNCLAFFPVDLPVSPTRYAYFKSFGFRAESYRPDHADKATAFILATPVPVVKNGEFVAPDQVWQRYLAKVNPDATLIRTGLYPTVAEQNYMNWLRPPDDFSIFLQHTRPLAAGLLPKICLSEPLEDVWRRFWDGHDRNGFSYHFIDLLNNIKICGAALVKNGESGFEKEKKDLLELNTPKITAMVLHSWKRYRAFWQVTPFYNCFQEVDDLLKPLEVDFITIGTYPVFSSSISIIQSNLERVQGILDMWHPFFKEEKNHEKQG